MTTTTNHTTNALAEHWQAKLDPDMDVWRVATARYGVADLVLDPRIAEHIAQLHNATLDAPTTASVRPIVEAHIGAHLAAQARTETRYGVRDAAGHVYEALGLADAQAMLGEVTCGPQPREVVTWHVTTSPPLAYLPPAAAETGATA